jgi:hypothetical protein
LDHDETNPEPDALGDSWSGFGAIRVKMRIAIRTDAAGKGDRRLSHW